MNGSGTLGLAVVAAALWMSAIPYPAETTAATEPTFPSWSYNLKLWPFDILYTDSTEDQISERLDAAVAAGANATIVYIEEEHMYGSFVDETGFAVILQLLTYLAEEAHDRGLRVIVYVNGLEVMTHNAVDPATCEETGVETMARAHPDWLQLDLSADPIVYSCLDMSWVTPDMEDAWVSPFSPYRELFQARLTSMGTASIDSVYIDATFMPGLQVDEENPRWGTTDQLAAADFTASTGFSAPTEDDWSDPAWRAWLLWRHEVVRDYLNELATAAWAAGMVPFWESSSNDSSAGTLLGNETAVTALNAMGFSPEIEPEGDTLAAFRMFQAARDFAPDHPLIYLGWPETASEAELQMAVALSFSGTLYPTADAPYPANAFTFADSIRHQALDRRHPYYGLTALVYSVRNKDWTWEEESHFGAYDDAFRDLAKAHIPFRVLVLEDLTEDILAPFETVILPGVVSLSDAEHALIDGTNVVLLGNVGTRDDHWSTRGSPLSWSNVLPTELDELATGLPFEIHAPETSWLGFYKDGTGGYFLFAVHDVVSGNMMLESDDPLSVAVWRPGHAEDSLAGAEIRVPILEPLSVLHVQRVCGPRRAGGRVGL